MKHVAMWTNNQYLHDTFTMGSNGKNITEADTSARHCSNLCYSIWPWLPVHSSYAQVLIGVNFCFSNQLVAAQADNEVLQEELDRLQARHTQLLQETAEKDQQWKNKLEQMNVEKLTASNAHTDTIQQMNLQNEALSQTFKVCWIELYLGILLVLVFNFICLFAVEAYRYPNKEEMCSPAWVSWKNQRLIFTMVSAGMICHL